MPMNDITLTPQTGSGAEFLHYLAGLAAWRDDNWEAGRWATV